MTKTLKIEERIHFKLKIFCVENKLKMNKWVEKLIDESIKNAKKIYN